MVIPQASINDLINTHNSAASAQPATSPNPISDFINMLGRYAQKANLSAGKAVGSAEQNAENWIGKNVGQPITNVVNQVGKAAGNTNFTGIPGMPTGSQAFNAVNSQIGNSLPGGDVLEGKSTPMSLALLGGTLAMGGENPEEAIKNPEDIVKTGEKKASMGQSIESMNDAAGGWKTGQKAQFDQALANGDSNTIQKLLPDVPDYYKTRMGGKISSILSDKQGLAETGAQPEGLPPIGSSDYPYQTSPNGFSKLGKGQNQAVRQIRLPAEVGGAQQEQAVHNTLDRLGFQGDAQQQYSQLQPKMTDLNDYITNELSDNPKNVPIHEVSDAFMKKLDNEFVAGNITKDAAIKEANDYINRLYISAKAPIDNSPIPTGTPSDINPGATSGTTGTTMNATKYTRMGGVKLGNQGPPGYLKEVSTGGGIPNSAQTATENPTMTDTTIPQARNRPTEIDTPTLYDMKVKANQQSKPLFKILSNGGALNDTQRVIMAGRNALDDVIAKYHPNIKSATTDMSNLFDAADSLEAARNNPPPPPQPLNAILPKAAQVFLPPVVQTGANKLLTNPTALKIGGALLGTSAIAGGAYYLGKKGEQTSAQTTSTGKEQQPTPIPQNTTNNQSHSGIISQSGKYSVVTPQEEGFMTGNDFRKQDNDYTKKITDATAAGDKYTATELAGQQKQLEDTWNDPKYQQVVGEGAKYNQFAGAANMAIPIIEKAPVGLFNLNGSYNNFLNSTDKKYQGLGIMLQKLQNETGIKFYNATNKDQLVNMLDTAINIMKIPYDSSKQVYYGGNTLNGGTTQDKNIPTPAGVQQSDNTGHVGVPVHYNFDFGRAGEGLPPIGAIPTQ